MEAEATRQGLHWTKGTLKTLSGSVHWHFKKASQKGMLEATWHPSAGRLWLKVAANRQATWIDAAIEGFVRAFGGA